MSANYRLSAAAEQSLDDIFNYTFDRWGEDQARRYINDLFAMFQSIADGNEPGRLIQAEYGVQGHYTRCGRHFVYWTTRSDGRIAIAEVLHERMNIGDRLAGSAELNRDEE